MWSTGSRHMGFSSCGSQALEHRLSRSGPVARGIFHTRSRACVLCTGRRILYPQSSRGEPLCRKFCLTPLAACRLSVYPLTVHRPLPTHQAEPRAHPTPSVGDVSWPGGLCHIPGRTSPTAASPGHNAQQHCHGARPSIAQLVERRTVDTKHVDILRSLVRFRLEGSAASVHALITWLIMH